ncbi:aminotransferase class IV family protein [Sulfurimonas sp. C5]|uniref:aminotransferase class IV family protein n=1 Tax=Sulfurimonas sp. C5 TaxID=3036947 RepID=UPI00245692BF|nr:aminotransferase class IV family protein [Sulfurimonas sp. C5]MDH4944591.1 aminotransferase class IV family protein [Sulfurimonas sp. C5]
MSKYLETIKIYNQKVYNLEYHQKRVDTTIGQGKLELSSIIQPTQKELTRCRIVYDEEGKYTIEYFPYKKRNIHSLKLVFCDDIDYDKKYENREKLNELFGKKESCDDILIVKNGLVTDTSIANIAFFDGVNWLTPKTPLLEGTMRAKLLNEEKIYLADIPYQELNKFQKIALLNAMIDFDIITKEKIEEVIC